jgi:hypothetical protein
VKSVWTSWRFLLGHDVLSLNRSTIIPTRFWIQYGTRGPNFSHKWPMVRLRQRITRTDASKHTNRRSIDDDVDG